MITCQEWGTTNFPTAILLWMLVRRNLPRLSIVNTLIPDELQRLVIKVKEENEERYIQKKNLSMKVLPEFQRMFAEVKEVSSKEIVTIYKGHNGRFHQLLRSTEKRRWARMAKEREQNIQEDEEKVKEINHEKDFIIQDLKEKIKNFKALSQENDKTLLY